MRYRMLVILIAGLCAGCAAPNAPGPYKARVPVPNTKEPVDNMQPLPDYPPYHCPPYYSRKSWC